MAYSDYGGYAYRNGARVEERSDAVLSPEGIRSTPGQWPGWTLGAAASCGSYHVLLGSGPIFVGLYKQSTVTLHRLGEMVEWLTPSAFPDRAKSYTDKDGLEHNWVDAPFAFTGDAKATRHEIDGHVLEVFWRETDNFYVYARLTEPDGITWTGFSGYGVGAGLEDADYGFFTEDCVTSLFDLFPPAETDPSGPQRSEVSPQAPDSPLNPSETNHG